MEETQEMDLITWLGRSPGGGHVQLGKKGKDMNQGEKMHDWHLNP